MKQLYESEVLFQLMERDGFDIPSSVPPYEAEIKAYLINQVKQAYPKLTDYEAEWLLYNYTKHLPAEFPISAVKNTTYAHFENVVPFAYQSAILTGSTKYRDVDTGEILESFEESRKLELVSVQMPVLTTTGKNLCGAMESGSLTQIEGEPVDYSSRIRTVDYIPIDGSYWISAESPVILGVRYYDINKKCIGYPTINTSENPIIVMNIPSGAKYLKFTVVDVTDVNYKIYLTKEKHTMGEYDTYKTNILSTSEEVVLRGIGDVKDELDLLTGEYVQRVEEIVVDGSDDEPWGEALEDDIFKTFHMQNNGKQNSVNFACDKLPKKSSWANSERGIWADNGLVVTLNKNEANSVIEFRNWLSQNPLTVQYELATESVKTVELTTLNESGETVHFMPLEGIMNVSTSSETIQPTFDMNVPVEATTQNLASFINMETEE